MNKIIKEDWHGYRNNNTIIAITEFILLLVLELVILIAIFKY